MAVSKVVYGKNTLIDLTGDTVEASTMLAGTTAHNAKGEPIEGTVQYAHYYELDSIPSNSFGENNDICIVM